MQPIQIDPRSGRTLADQIAQAVRGQIADRLLRPGMRLPPIRGFAAQLGVSRFTVVEAYDRLVASGHLVSRRGAGFYVADAVQPKVPQHVAAPFEQVFDNAGVMRESLADDGRLKVGAGWLPDGWLDADALRGRLRALAGDGQLRATAYGTPEGYLPLREQLQVQLAERGIAAAPSQILLTHGATQALDIVARCFLRPGDCVFVDDPGYWNLFASLRLLGVRLVGVPRRPDGPDIEAMQALLAEHRPRVMFTHSVLHNPTSTSITLPVAHRLLQLAATHDFLVVEDDTYADFANGLVTRLAGLDQLERVIYVSSFSKTLSANLRVGFLAASRDIVGACTDIKLFTAVTSSELAERVVCDLLQKGQYRKAMERLRGRLARVMDSTLHLFERAGVVVHAAPAGGMFVWASAPPNETPLDFAARAAAGGVTLAPGHLFRPQLQASEWLRYNAAYAEDARFTSLFFGAAAGLK